MATNTDGQINRWIFQWKIENISSWFMKKGEGIYSPTFIADALEGTKWALSVYPMGETDENYFGFYLHRRIDCSAPFEIEVNYQFAILSKDGPLLKGPTLKNTFQKPKRWRLQCLVAREKVFVTEREAFIPENTLIVQCTVWKEEQTPIKPQNLFARTFFKVHRKSFVWRIHKFSTFQSSVGKKFKDSFIEFDLVLNEEPDFDKKIMIYINSFDERIKYFSFETYIVDSEGNKEDCEIYKYFTDDLEKGVLSSMRLLTKKCMENKSRYLPNDVLSLNCQHIISCQNDSREFLGSVLTLSSLTNEDVESRNEHYTDMKSMYNDAIFSDTELRTLTRNFPVHKNILSARSPVFRRMFSLDMKEKNCGYVEITDFDDDTVNRMLTYIYTVSLEDLSFESAFNLYAAADKYEILSLRNRCSSFLKDNLCPSKACDVFLLADQHQDVDLKCFVQDYILDYDEEAFCSLEWRDFMNSHPKLAAHIMYGKYMLSDHEVCK